MKGQSAVFFVTKMIVFSYVAEPSRWIVVCELCTSESHFIQHQAVSTHNASWYLLLPHTVNSWTVFYKGQVTFCFVQTPIQALTLINWLWPHVLSALANCQRADTEGGRFVMEQRKNDKKGNLWFTKRKRSREVSRCTHAQTPNISTLSYIYSTHMLVQTLPPHAHFDCLLCNRLQMWCWGGEVFVCHLLGRLRIHPSEGDAVSPDGGGPGPRPEVMGLGVGRTGHSLRTSGSTSGQQGPAAWKVRCFDLTWAAQHGEHATVWMENKALAYTHTHTWVMAQINTRGCKHRSWKAFSIGWAENNVGK